MKVSDYIVEYLIQYGTTDVFGYPGGMVTHLIESFRKYKHLISAHITCHEQAAAFAACGYAQTSGKPGVAYATSGPGATNLITGICNAYFDSIPTVFITGQVNTYESKGQLGIRQRGFQETDIISMISCVTKYAAYVDDAHKIKYYLDKAFSEAMNGRKGPTLLDIPMDIFRADIEPSKLHGYIDAPIEYTDKDRFKYDLKEALDSSSQPCILIGNGVKLTGMQKIANDAANHIKLPFLTSMIAFDVMADNKYYYGFIGAYGCREANFIAAKSDLIISIGSRLDIRQVGAIRDNFAINAKLMRVDIDKAELDYSVHQNERSYLLPIEDSLNIINEVHIKHNFMNWLTVCNEIKLRLKNYDLNEPNRWITGISKKMPDTAIITTDVGQNQVWIAQSFKVKANQKILFSGGHGAMGYSLPAAIGAYYGCNKEKAIFCFSGDGGLQMNIQELHYIAREKLPIKIIVINNNSLGMIRHFQEMYFNSMYYQTNEEGGYNAPDFCKLAGAYGIEHTRVYGLDEIKDCYWIESDKPFLLEIRIDDKTYVFPKLEYGKPNQDQEPYLDRDLYKKLMSLGVQNA